jgi:hypothetical protein
VFEAAPSDGSGLRPKGCDDLLAPPGDVPATLKLPKPSDHSGDGDVFETVPNVATADQPFARDVLLAAFSQTPPATATASLEAPRRDPRRLLVGAGALLITLTLAGLYVFNWSAREGGQAAASKGTSSGLAAPDPNGSAVAADHQPGSNSAKTASSTPVELDAAPDAASSALTSKRVVGKQPAPKPPTGKRLPAGKPPAESRPAKPAATSQENPLFLD